MYLRQPWAAHHCLTATIFQEFLKYSPVPGHWFESRHGALSLQSRWQPQWQPQSQSSAFFVLSINPRTSASSVICPNFVGPPTLRPKFSTFQYILDPFSFFLCFSFFYKKLWAGHSRTFWTDPFLQSPAGLVFLEAAVSLAMVTLLTAEWATERFQTQLEESHNESIGREIARLVKVARALRNKAAREISKDDRTLLSLDGHVLEPHDDTE